MIELYHELDEETRSLIVKNKWVEIGVLPPSLNGRLVTIYKKIKDLEKRVTFCERCNGFNDE